VRKWATRDSHLRDFWLNAALKNLGILKDRREEWFLDVLRHGGLGGGERGGLKKGRIEDQTSQTKLSPC